MSEDRYEALKLRNQICFPLYICAKEVTRRYKPYLSEINLTYTQYVVMMALWEDSPLTVSGLGRRLLLDSGTLTPLLKRLEEKGYVQRERSEEDERELNVSLTEKGLALRDKAVSIPGQMAGCVNLTPEDAGDLYRLLYKLINSISEEQA